MRSYGQFCGLAKALDVVGDRWTLLIVRELLVAGRSRYTDLMNGLPGIATNMLSERLADLEKAGLVVREDPEPPVATSLFRLTDRGKEVEPVIFALGRWAAPIITEPAPGDTFRSHWLAFPLRMYLTDNSPSAKPVTIELRTGDRPILVEVGNGRVEVRPGTSENADAVVTGEPQVAVGLMTGRLTLNAARKRGLHFQGDPVILSRIQPASRK